jgi:hypothetical protein
LKRKSPLLLAISLNVFLVVVLGVVFNFLPVPLFLPCTHPLAQSAILALGVVMMFQLVFGAKILPRSAILTICMMTLLLLAFWLGSYPYSPLGFSTGRIPVLRSFMITTRSGPPFSLAPGEVLSLGRGSAAAIEPVLLAGKVKCAWSSAKGGRLDTPEVCDLVYSPPAAEYDLLRVQIQPACGLPASTAQIKISILP